MKCCAFIFISSYTVFLFLSDNFVFYTILIVAVGAPYTSIIVLFVVKTH